MRKSETPTRSAFPFALGTPLLVSARVSLSRVTACRALATYRDLKPSLSFSALLVCGVCVPVPVHWGVPSVNSA
eukprot:2663572-Rhodomonas_salina.1